MQNQYTPPVIKTDAPELFFVSIIPNFAGQEDYLAELITGRFYRSGITRYAMSYPLHPQGQDVYDKVRIQAASFRKLKAMLKDLPIQLGILLQSTIGHGGYWNLAPDCSITGEKTVKADGSNTIRFCPYEPNFLDYIYNATKIVAAEGPAFLMGDDDMRMGDDACFCPHHLEELYKLTGKRYTREELVPLLAGAKPHDPLAAAFEQVNIGGMDALCKAVRRAVDELDPAISCAVCICGPRFDYVKSQLKYIGGPAPFLRISNANYLESNAKDQARIDRNTSWQTVNFRKLGIPLLDESDTCPHHRWSKSARTMHLHIVSGIIHGVDGGKLWLDQSAFPLPEEARYFEDTISKHQGLYRELHSLMRRFTPAGTITHIPPLEREPFPYRGMAFHRKSDWGVFVFGRMGIPVFYSDMDAKGIHLLAGEQVNYYTDDEIKTMLSSAALVDGVAAAILTKRGFADMLGTDAECEKLNSDSFTGNVQQQMLSAAQRKSDLVKGNSEEWLGHNMYFTFSARDNTAFLTPHDNAEKLTAVGMAPYRGAKREVFMPGAVYFENASGGKVVTVAMNIMEWPYMMVLHPARKKFFVDVLKKLGGIPAYLTATHDCKLVTGTLDDNSKLVIAINYGYDPLPVELITDTVPAGILELQDAGDYAPVKFTAENGKLAIDRTLEPAKIGIFILK